MDAAFDCTARCCQQESSLWSRRGVAEKVAQFDTLDSPWTSTRQIAGQLHVPARTLHHWIHREWALIESSSWPKRVARFLETPEGLDFLHRLFTAAHLVFVEANDCGLRNLSWFLELSGLDEFIAPSYGAQQAVAGEMESLVIRLRTLAAEVLARARSPDGLWGTFSRDLQADLESKARQCADFFQRSSSCVEGRNGQLSLRHHALHQLTKRKLQALTVLHNYAVQREDGSTAAERYYGAAPRDLFGWLLQHLTLPARPRAVRPGT
jgi:hypothetical protein